MDAFVSSCEEDLCGSNSEHEPDKRRLFFDTYRWLHPAKQNAFTCWCTLTGARQTNYGSRIDYILADFGMLPLLAACGIMADVEGSDHCPVKVEFNCSAIAASTCPSLCTKYFPQFAGRQQKLLQYLAPKFSIEKNSCETKSFKELTLSGDRMHSSKYDMDGSENEISEYHVSWNKNFAGRFNGETQSDEQDLHSKTVDCAPESSKIVGIKRKTEDLHTRKLKKSKNYDPIGSGKQSSLFNFFKQPLTDKDECKLTRILCGRSNVMTLSKTGSNDHAALKASLTGEEKYIDVITQSDECVGESSRTSTISAWKSLLKGPPRNVLCNGHQEPCVLRTVKKDGPNKGKQFWTCNRPEGHKTNPEARCDYFLWVSQTK
jgi:AP endonuclease 2